MSWQGDPRAGLGDAWPVTAADLSSVAGEGLVDTLAAVTGRPADGDYARLDGPP